MISPHETRISFTQYTAGGLFRWVSNDYQTEDYLKKNKPHLYKKIMAAKPLRRQRAVNAFSVLEELHGDRVAAGLVRDNACRQK